MIRGGYKREEDLVSEGIMGTHPDRADIGIQGFFPLSCEGIIAAQEQEGAMIEISFVACFLVILISLVEFTEGEPGNAGEEREFAFISLQIPGNAIFLKRIFGASLQNKKISQLLVIKGILGFEPNRLAIRFFRLIQSAQGTQIPRIPEMPSRTPEGLDAVKECKGEQGGKQEITDSRQWKSAFIVPDPGHEIKSQDKSCQKASQMCGIIHAFLKESHKEIKNDKKDEEDSERFGQGFLRGWRLKETERKGGSGQAKNCA